MAISETPSKMHDIELLYEFSRIRQPHCQHRLNVINVLQFGGGRENYCLNNAKEKADEMGYAVVSGWLCLPTKFLSTGWQKQFTQHWWNYDRSEKRHLDFSPTIDDGAVYMQDLDIALFAIDANSRLRSHVASSVILRNGMIYIVDYGNEGYRHRTEHELSNETLFYFQLADSS